MSNELNKETNIRKSRNIAKNSIILFVRMIVITLVNLYAVRLVFNGLGEVDYGIYNVLAGVVTVLVSLNTVLSLAVQRYYSLALGHGDSQRMCMIYSASVNINLVLVGIIIIFSEFFGLWLINSKLVFPVDRFGAVTGCFHLSMVSFLCTFLQVPFVAAIIAKENMGTFAWISTAECMARLLVAALIPVSGMDGLLFYSGGLALTSVCIVLAYFVVCRLRCPECRYVSVNQPGLYKSLLSFSGWTMYGSLSNVGLIQGNTILLNIFFGPLLNVAFAIALQVNNAFTALSNTVIVAFRPAIVKSYAKGDTVYVNRLFYAGNKFILYLLSCIAIPMIFEMDTILRLWLGKASADVLLFVRCIIVYVVCMAMNNPVTAIIQAVGQVKAYHLRVDTITLLCLPLTWLLFKFGMPAYSLFYSMIGLCLLAHTERLFCLRRYYRFFSIKTYMKELLPFVPILFVSVLFAYILRQYVPSGIVCTALVFLCVVPFFLMLVFFLGLNRFERNFISSFVKSFIHRIS